MEGVWSTVRFPAILCTGGLDVIRKEAWPFYRTISVSAYVGSSKNLKDLKDPLLTRLAVSAELHPAEKAQVLSFLVRM